MFRAIPLVAILLAGCTSSSRVSVCDVVAQPGKYNGRSVTMSGTFRQGHHGAVLVDSACPDSAIAVGEPDRIDRAFQDVVWANYLPSGRSITASLQGKYVYTPAPRPGHVLDNYALVSYQLGKPKSSP